MQNVIPAKTKKGSFKSISANKPARIGEKALPIPTALSNNPATAPLASFSLCISISNDDM